LCLVDRHRITGEALTNANIVEIQWLDHSGRISTGVLS
jgi:hypothetical protein